MSTHCVISLKHESGYTAIYCHSDGYDKDEGVGPTLRKYYATIADARDLIKLGDIGGVSENAVLAYHRDWKEPWHRNAPKKFSEFDALKAFARNMGTYLYVFEDGEWKTYRV